MMGKKRCLDEKDAEENQDECGGLILDVQMNERKCGSDLTTVVECQADAEMIDLDLIVEEDEQHQMSKRICLEEKPTPRPQTNITLRRNGRQNCGLDVPSHALELPPSSENVELQGIPVAYFFYVYSFLRSFGMVLFLSPFTIEAFAESLRCEFSNPLVDFAHFSLLKVIRMHLKKLAKEGDVFASNCMRVLNWRLLDSRCWPIFLAEYLGCHRTSLKPCLRLVQRKILRSGYYKLSAKIKVDILHFLCENVFEMDLVKSEIKRRLSEIELDLGNNHDTDYQIKKDFTPNGLENSPSPPGSDRDDIDQNNNECSLCEMDGNLICCDGCPASFHSRCLGIPKVSLPMGNWYCPECLMGKVDQCVKPSRAFSTFFGAELLGIDIQGRQYFGCYGYLLVSNSLGIDFGHYYNKNSLNSVIEALMASSSTLYSDIIIAIKNYWGILDNSTSSTDVGCENKESNYGISLVHASVPHFKEDIIVSKSNRNDNYASPGCMDSTSTHYNSLTKDNLSGICPESTIENPQSTKTQIGGVDYSTVLSNIYAKEDELPSETDEELKNWISQVQSGPSSYINFYYFGHISSSITVDITSELMESSIDDDKIISTQLGIFSKNFSTFDFSVFQNSSLDAHKERCGWCFYCRSPNHQECLLYIAERKFLESPQYLPTGICTTNNEQNHMDSLVHNCLFIESSLHGLLSGPWEDPCYSTQWRQSILEATNTESIKMLLLTLESNVRQIALSNEFTIAVRKQAKNISWRKAVKASTIVAQVIYHVKDFHSNIRWEDFKNTNVFSWLKNGKSKQVEPIKDVQIHRKIVQGNEVTYVVDFRRRKNIPDIVTKQATKHGVTLFRGFKHYWLNEAIVPLGLVKDYESKMVGRKHKLNGTVRHYLDPNTHELFYEEIPDGENHQHGQCMPNTST